MKKPLVILTGPTSAGKTALSIQLAKKINGAILSADSIQVYRHMDIGSGKITHQEMDGIDHYLIDILDPTEEFNVVLFKQYAVEAMQQIYAQGKIPIIVGGTGFYIQSVLYDIDFTSEEEHPEYRLELEALAREKGAHYLHEMLRSVDEKAAEQIHENNIKRVIRAIEFHHFSGQKISEHNETERQKQSPYAATYFVLTDDRAAIYERINQRVDHMLAQGLVDEVKALKEMGCTSDMTSIQGLGYKEIFAYLQGDTTLEEAVYLIKRDTRHFAKRQLTWFRRERDIIWVDRSAFQNNEEAMLQYMLEQLSGITANTPPYEIVEI